MGTEVIIRQSRNWWQVFWIVAACLVPLMPASAQTQAGRPSLLDPTQPNLLLELQQRVLEASATGQIIALEGAIDPEAYTIGPGDQFAINIGGMLGTSLVIPVSAKGDLFLPEVGAIAVSGRTLAEAEADAEAKLQASFRNVTVDVTLAQPRAFLVHVSGTVPEPGRYLMFPMARVDDALQQAVLRAASRLDPASGRAPQIPGSSLTERPALAEAYQASLRNVLLHRRDSTTLRLDLMRYYAVGDLDQNPYLRDGDVIEVPPYHQERDAVRVSGEIAYPGTLDYRPGDTALDVLRIAAGPNGLEQLGEVRLTHDNQDGTVEHTLLDIPRILAGEADDVPITPRDHLNVLAEEYATAAIHGLVEYPGTYPIQDGETTLRELIELGGGLQPDANPRAAFIERRKSLYFKQTGAATDLDFFSRAYLQQSLSRNYVVVDLAEALQPGAEDVVIYDQDRVVFPRDEGTVFVTGNVPQAGFVEFVEGQRAGYYVDVAGGKGPLSRAVYVFSPDGSMQTGERTVVRQGDTIFVDREDIAESPEIATLLISDRNARRQARIMNTQTIITGISAITSIVTAYVALRSISD